MKTLIAAAFAAFLAMPAFAATPECDKEGVFEELLSNKYGERIVDETLAPAPGGSKRLILWTLWANTSTGSWTVMATADGITCAMQAGMNYTDDMRLKRPNNGTKA